MRMYKVFRLLFATLLVLSTFFSNGVQAEGMTLDTISESWAKSKSQQKLFIETSYDPLLEIRSTQKGKMIYRAPNTLEQHYDEPNKGTITFTDTLITLDFPNRKAEITTQSAPVLAALSQTLLDLLRGDIKGLEQRFSVDFKNLNNQNWQIILTPTALLKRHLDSITINGSEQTINNIVVTQISGEWRQISFTDSVSP